MKIALIAPSMLPARRANTIQVMKMAQAIKQTGLTVEVIVPYPGGKHQVTLPATGKPNHNTPANWTDLRVQYGLDTTFPITWLPVIPTWRGYDYGIRAVHLAKKLGAALIYTRTPQAAAYASWRGIPVVLETHDYPAGRMGALLFQRFLRGRGKRRLVSITRALLDDLRGAFNFPNDEDFSIVAPDGVDLRRYDDALDPQTARTQLHGLSGLDLQPDAFVVGYTGHLYPGRGGRMLLALAEQLPMIHFLLVGGEPKDVTHLQAQCEKRNVGNITLTGFVPNEALPVYQKACDVLLMPYQDAVAGSSGGDIARYFSPMKMFEYLACGRAIISSDLPVLREVLNSSNAVLLPGDDVEAWVEAIRGLQPNPEQARALGAQARQDAEKYTWASRADHIFDFYVQGAGGHDAL